MNASDVMISNVITVGPNACVQDVAAVLLKNGISAVPVVDANGALLGIVSEGDLMQRPEGGTERRHSVWLELLTTSGALAQEYVKSHSRTVADVMSKNVITAPPTMPVREVAALLEKNRIKRVPIVKDGKVVGIVSRANLLQALASSKKGQLQTAASDATIRESIIAQLNNQTWTQRCLMNVTVQDGTAEIWGIVGSETEKKAVNVLAEVTPGVRAVIDHLMVRPMALASQ